MLRHLFSLIRLTDLTHFLIRKPTWTLSKAWPKENTFSHNEIGQIGEDLSALFLQNAGYKILYRNYKPSRGGEIDLICKHQDVLIFVEVKTRIAPSKRRPLLNITREKRAQLRKGAFQYLRLLQSEEDKKYPPTGKKLALPTRFDAVEVLLYEGKSPLINCVKGLQMREIKTHNTPFQRDFL